MMTNPCRLATHSIYTNQSRFTCQNSSPAPDQHPSEVSDQAGKQGFSWREGCKPGGHNPQPAETLTTLTLTYGDYRIRTDDPLLAKQVLYQLS